MTPREMPGKHEPAAIAEMAGYDDYAPLRLDPEVGDFWRGAMLGVMLGTLIWGAVALALWRALT